MPAGIEAKIGVGRETTWGTGVTSTRWFTARENLNEERGRLREAMTFGTRSTLPADPGRLRIRETLSDIPGRPQTVGELLRAALGAPQTTGSGPYVHTYVPAAAKHDALAALPPYSLTVKRRSDVIDRLTGGQLDSLELRQPVDEALTLNAEFIFKSITTGTDEAMTLDAGERFRYKHLAVTKGGNPFPYLTDLTIQIQNNLDPEETLNGSDEISAVDFGDKLVVAISGQATFRDKSLLEEFRAGTAAAWSFTWTINANTSLEIAVPRLALDSVSAPIEGPGRITVAWSGTAEFDASEGHEIEVTLTNDVASYA